MENKFERVRRQKHIWQIAFVVLAIAFFVQTFFLYKNNAVIADKVKRIFSLDSRSTLKIEGFLEGQAVRNHPLEMQDIARPVNGT
jgi:hypothetical protein